jgi:hypothetical protein
VNKVHTVRSWQFSRKALRRQRLRREFVAGKKDWLCMHGSGAVEDGASGSEVQRAVGGVDVGGARRSLGVASQAEPGDETSNARRSSWLLIGSRDDSLANNDGPRVSEI